MSYRQFRGDAGLSQSSVGPSPALIPSTDSISTDSLANDGGDATENQPDMQDSVPNLPVTSDNGAKNSAYDAALLADGDSISARAAAFAVIACFGFGIVAAASVVSVRRFMKANS